MTLEKQHYIFMRRAMGILIIALSIVTILFGLIGAYFGINPNHWFASISTTYYSNANGLMVAILAITGFFFITYPGYDWKDKIINTISGIGLLGLIIFPCSIEEYASVKVGLFCLPNNISGLIHNIISGIVFVAFFINIVFLFTKSNGDKTDKKKLRNIIYYIAGASICPVAGIFVILNALHIGVNLTWVAEFLSLTPCGIAWLVKGEAIKALNDD